MAITVDCDHRVIAERVVGCWEDWTMLRRRKEQRWEECVMNYLVEVDESKYEQWPWRSRVADTLSQETGDTVASSLLNGLFPLDEKFLELKGADERSVQHAPAMMAYLESQLKATQFIESVRPWAKQIAVIGNAPYLGGFAPIHRPIRRREARQDLKTKKLTYHTKEVSGMSTIRFQCLDAFDVVFDPKALTVAESPIIWRVVMPKARVLQMKNVEHLDEIEPLEGAGPSQASDYLKDKRARAFGLTTTESQQERSDPDEVELLLCYGDIEIDGELYFDHLVIVANRTTVLRAEREPFWSGRPIGWGGYDQLWMTGYEKGPLEPLLGVQSLIDTFQNQKADILNLIINGAFAYVNDGVIDPGNLWLRPGGMIEVGDINNLKPLQPSANVALTYQELAQLREQAERSSGKSRFDMGQAPGGRRTAYEANLIRGGGSARANDILRHIGNGPIESYLTWALGTLQQMKWDSGEVHNDVLAGSYTLNFLGADLTALRSYQVQNLMTAIQVMAQAPPEMTAHVNARYIWSRLFQALTMDDDKALNSPEEAARILAMTAQRGAAQPSAPQGQSGSGVGGQDEALMSLMQNLGAAA